MNLYLLESVIQNHPKVRKGEKYTCQPDHREFCLLWQPSNTWEWQVKNSRQKTHLLQIIFCELSRKQWSNWSTEVSTPSRATGNPAWICGPSYLMLLSEPNELVLIFLYICPSPRCNHLLIIPELLCWEVFCLQFFFFHFSYLSLF